MKKNILKVALVAAFALFAGYSVYTSQKSVDLSALALDNVEALASETGSGDYDCGNTCSGAKCGTFTDNSGNSCTVYYC
jgi:hypothetical protein